MQGLLAEVLFQNRRKVPYLMRCQCVSLAKMIDKGLTD